MRTKQNSLKWAALSGGLVIGFGALLAQDGKQASSYMPVDIHETFGVIFARMTAAKPEIIRRHTALLEQRYDLSDRPAHGVTMSRSKLLQQGVRVKLPTGVTWDQLAAMSPEQIKERGLFPAGFEPLPHPNHAEGGMVFPKSEIDEIKKQEGRDLTRFDLDFDIPDHFLPEFPPPMYLTTRPDLGDVSQGKLVTLDNYYEVFNGLLNPKQLDGLRLLLTAFPQQQFNQSEDRRSERASRGVACFDCHANGHTNRATHLVGDIRPQEVHAMGEFQEILDFPPAPKLGIDGKLDPKKASAVEMRGQQVFFGKGRCAECHAAPFYTDNLMHNLQAERFYKSHMVNGMMAASDGPIKTFPLRGVKDSPPYLHDGRLLTLEDTVEFFNLIMGVQLTGQEKADLVAFMRAL